MKIIRELVLLCVSLMRPALLLLAFASLPFETATTWCSDTCSPKLSSGAVILLCVSWLSRRPLHLFKAQIATDLTQIDWVPCECNLDSDPSQNAPPRESPQL